MCRFSSKSSLLAGVSAVVLAASVGSGAFAQAVDYTHSTAGSNIWADGTARNASNTSSTDMAEARAGDNLTLSAGRVGITGDSRSGASIGELRSGASGAGGLLVTSSGRTIRTIIKQGTQAVDLSLVARLAGDSVLTVEEGAVVRNLAIDFQNVSSAGEQAKATFKGNLTAEGITQIKAGNNSTNPVNAFLELEGDATFGGDVTLDDQGTGGRAYMTISGSADQTIGRLNNGTAKITAAADGEGTIQVLNGRDGLAPRKATFDIEIGHDAATDANDRRLRQLTVGDASKGGHAIFNRGVHVDHINVIAGNHDNEKTTVEFRGNVSGDTIKLTSTRSGQFGYGPTAVFNASTGDTTVDNEIVGSRASAAGIRIIGGRSGNRQHKVTFNGKIGPGNNPLSSVSVGWNGTDVAERDKSAGEAIFKEDVGSYFFEVNGGNAANEHSRATVEKDLNVYGFGSGAELSDYAGSATLTIGGAGRLATVNDAGQTIRGGIEAGGDGQGKLIVDNRGDATTNANNNKVTFNGSVGRDGTALRQITLKDGRTTFNSGVYARSITITTGDATVFKGHVKAGTGANEGIKLGTTNGSVTFSGTTGQTVAGNIMPTIPGRGWITVANKAGVTFEDDLGTPHAWLRLLTLTGHATAADASKATFKGNVYLRTGANGGLVLGQNTGVTFNGTDSQTVAGSITSASGGNYGTITIDNDDGVTFKGALGASGTNNGLNRLTLSDNSEATFEGHVYLANGLILGNSTITFDGRNQNWRPGSNQTIKADISNSTGKRGSVVVNNGGTTNNNIVTFEGAVGASGNDLAGLSVRDGVARFKGDVFAGALLVESTDGAEFRGNVTTGALGISFAGNDAAKITLNGAVNQIVTGDITTDSDGRGLLVVNNSHATTNKVTFGGSVGADGTALKQITLSAGRTTFHSGVYADTINITTDDETTFKGDVKAETRFRLGNGSSVTFNGTSGQTVTGDITRAAGGDYGTIIVANTHADGVTFAGQLGASGQKLNRVTLNDDSNATFEGSVYLANGLKLGDDATITFGGSDNQTIKADIRNSTGKRGSVVVDNSGTTNRTVTFEDDIGATGGANHLARITVSDGVAVFKGAVFAQGLEVSSTDGAGFKGNITTGGISFTGNNEAKITLNGTANQTVTGDITTDSDGRGRLVVNNSHATTNKVTFAGQIGTGGDNGKALKQITLGNGQTVFNGSVYADTITINTTDVTTFKGDVKADTGVKLGNGSSVTFGDAAGTDAAGQTITGNITSAAGGNYGAIIIANTHADGVTFKGNLGASGNNNGLSRVTLNNNVKAAFGGNVYLGNGLTFGNGSQVTFNGTDSQTVAGDLTSASGGNYGTITIANDDGVTFTGNLGTTGAKLTSLTLNDDSSATFEGSVYLANGLKLGDDATITFGGSGNQTIKAGIRNSTGKRGSVVVNNSGTTNRTVTFEDAVGGSGTGNDLARLTLDNGQTVFAGAVYAGTIDVNAGSDGTTFNSSVTTRAGLTLAGAATFKGSVTTGVNGLVFDGAGGAATFAGTAAQTITPAITTDANNRGAITIANRAGVTFEDDLGTNAAKLARLTLHTGTKATLEQSGYFAGNVTLRNTATLIVGDASDVTGTNGRGTGVRDAQTITGNIVAGDDGQGDLEIRNRSSHATGQKVSFTGSIGTAEAALNRITVADGETTFGGDVYAGNLNITARDATTFKGNVKAGTQFTLGDGSSVTFGGTAGQRITGDITSASGGDYGAIIIANTDGVTFEGALGASGGNNGLRSLTVNEDAKVTFNRPVYLSGDLTAHRKSTLTLGPAFGERTGDAADQAFITVGGNFDLGTADADNSVRIAFDSSFTEGEQKLINKDLSAAIDNGKLILVESNVLKYELATDDGGSVIARAKGFKSAGEVSSKLGVSPSEATVLLAASSLAKDLPANDPVKKILQEAAQAGNEAQGKRLAAQLTPQTTALGGATAAVVSTGTQVAGVLSERLSVQRGGDSQSGFVQSGFATGGEGLDRAFWLRPFGSRGKQAKDKKQRIDGYDTSARGLAVGVDAPVGERGRVGTALAYSTSRMTGKGVGEDKTDVRSWQVSVYGDYSTARYYVDGQVGVGRNDVSTTSRVAGLRRKAAYDTTSLTASVGGGVPLRLDASTTLTPTAGLSWTRVGSANYTTTGALSLNQKITVGSIDAVVGTLGTRLHKEITRGNGTLVPVVRVGLSYDFAGDQTTARGRFTGGGSRFTVKGAKVKKLSGTAGVGLSYSAPRWSIGADYDLSARPGYTGHSARLNARVKF